MKKILLLIPLFIFFCGCSNYNELSDLAIVTGMAVDIKEDEYVVSTLISNSQKAEESSKEGNAGTVVYSGKGKTVSEALKQIDTKIPKQLYFSHIAVVVISEEVAKKGVAEITDFFFRSPESTKRFYLIMAKDDKAEDVIKILTPLETFPSQNIKLNIESTNKSTAISVSMTYSKFIENYLKKGADPYLPTISIIGSSKKGSKNENLESSDLAATVQLKSLALFKNTKFVGYANDDESRGINIINSVINDMIITTDCDNKEAIIAISELKSKKSVKFKNDEPTIYIDIVASGAIQEVTCDIDLRDPDEIENLEKSVEKKIKKLANKGIKRAKELKTDVFGFGNFIYKRNPKYFKSVKNWYDEFEELEIKFNVDVKLETKGSIKQSIKAANNDDSK